VYKPGICISHLLRLSPASRFKDSSLIIIRDKFLLFKTSSPCPNAKSGIKGVKPEKPAYPQAFLVVLHNRPIVLLYFSVRVFFLKIFPIIFDRGFHLFVE